MDVRMRETALLEDLNRLACAEAQERYSGDPERLREELRRLHFVDWTDLPRFRREGWLSRGELDLIERLADRLRRLPQIPVDADPLAFSRGDPDWQGVRQHALEIVEALDGFVDLGVAGWGARYRGR